MSWISISEAAGWAKGLRATDVLMCVEVSNIKDECLNDGMVGEETLNLRKTRQTDWWRHCRGLTLSRRHRPCWFRSQHGFLVRCHVASLLCPLMRRQHKVLSLGVRGWCRQNACRKQEGSVCMSPPARINTHTHTQNLTEVDRRKTSRLRSGWWAVGFSSSSLAVLLTVATISDCLSFWFKLPWRNNHVFCLCCVLRTHR